MKIFGRRTMGAVAMLSAGAVALGGCSRGEGDETAQATDAVSEQRVASPVSYTHLTLPTILLV